MVVQEKYSKLISLANPHLMFAAPHLHPGSAQSDTALTTGARKIRVGFLSKFFTMNHAHGQLLRV